MRIIAVLFLVIVMSGCCWFLPEGEPPTGNILDNPQNNNEKVYTLREAVDYMTSALTLAILERCPGEKIVLKPTDNLIADNVAFMALHESSKITGNQTVARNSDWELCPELTGRQLTLSLLHRGQKVWQETVICQ